MSDAPKPSPLAAPEPWNLVADDYTLEILPWFEVYARAALELAPTAAGARVLDVAAGPGTLTLIAAESGRSVSAIDFAPQMVQNLRRRLNGAQLGADVRVGDAQVLPWGDAEFDAVFSMFGLMFFPDRARGFAELLRVLKPGATAVVSSWAPFEGLFKSVMAAMSELLPDIPIGKGKAPLGDPEEFAAEMKAAGFAEVRVVPKTHAEQLESVAAVWGSLERTNAPTVLLKRNLGEAKWAEVTLGVISRLEREHGSGAVELRSTALLGVGKKP
jgi:SAM-dependent methyltransferase